MSNSIEPALGRDFPRFDPEYFRPMALVAMLASEILFFTVRFEIKTSLLTGHPWSLPLRQSRPAVRFLLLAAFAIGALGGLRLVHRFRRALWRDREVLGHPWSAWFLAHGLALIALAGLTSFVCEGDLEHSARPGAWVAAWLASILAVGITWLGSFLSPSAWREIAKRSLRVIASGLAIAWLALQMGDSTGRLWDSMAGATLALVRGMLGLVAGRVACEPDRFLIGVDDFRVTIARPCSGYEGIGLVLAFLAGYFLAFRRSLRWPRAYLLLPVGAALIWLLNAARIAALVLIGAWVSPGVAVGGFHSQAGWLAFLGVSLGLVWVSRRSPYFASDLGGPDERARWSNPSLSYLGPFLAVLATSLVTAALSTGFDPLYGLRVLTGGLALWHFRRDFAEMLRGGSWAGFAIGVAAFALWVALEPASGGGSGASLASRVRDLPPGRAWAWIALRVIGSVAIVPVVEELAFRGFLARRLISADFESVPAGRISWASLLISSAVFGLLHGRWLAGMLVGVLYALAFARRGRLGDAILAHAVTNALIAATVLATGDWSMWS